MPHSVHSSREASPAGDDELGLLFWNCNMPRKLWTAECPEFLMGQAEKNQNILSSSDQDFKTMTWREVQYLVSINRIDCFQRQPSQLRQYLKFMHLLKKRHGSVMTFVQQKRLQWSSADPSAHLPFTNPSDYRIVYNDWPYGIDPDIVHLVVWTKFQLEDDPFTDDLTPEARQTIEKFVIKTFCAQDGLARDGLVWFKNWKSLKSIHALEHFHVMLYRPSAAFVHRVTNGDQPISVMSLLN